MTESPSTRPVLFGWLTLPYGLASGWTVPLAVRLYDHGFDLGTGFTMLYFPISLFFLKLIMAPVMDTVGFLRRWYLVGLILAVGGMAPFLWLPADMNNATVMTILHGVSLSGAMLTFLAATGFLATDVPTETLGRAAAWYLAGILGGERLAIEATHLPFTIPWAIATAVEMALMGTGAVAVYRLYTTAKCSRPALKETAKQALTDARTWFRSRTGIFIILLALSPIGVGAATVGWSNVARAQGMPEDRLLWIAGPFSAIATIAGYLAAGWASDRFGKWKTWFWTVSLLAAMALVLVFSPVVAILLTTAGMLLYVFLTGCCTAAFLAVIVESLSPRLAITTIVLLSMAATVASGYMRAFDGWLTDDFSFRIMLIGEALLSLTCIYIALFVKRKLRIGEEIPALN